MLPAEMSGEPETKEELVDSEYGGGQDTEPLRPSSTGDLSSYLVTCLMTRSNAKGEKSFAFASDVARCFLTCSCRPGNAGNASRSTMALLKGVICMQG